MADDPTYRTRFYRTYSSGFAGETGFGRAAPTLRTEVIAHVPADREAQVLDAGCGQGELLALLEHAGYRRLTGVDISAEQIVRARSRGLRATLEHGDLSDHLARHRGAYDAVLAVDVLEHFDKEGVVELLDLFAGALGPSGRLVLRVPNAETPYAGRLRYGDFTHGVAFTHHSIRQVLIAAGFSEVRVLSTSPVAHSALSLARLGLWKIVSAQRKLSLAIETGLVRGHIVSQNLVAVADRFPQGSGR